VQRAFPERPSEAGVWLHDEARGQRLHLMVVGFTNKVLRHERAVANTAVASKAAPRC
jgi:hypothetical protein